MGQHRLVIVIKYSNGQFHLMSWWRSQKTIIGHNSDIIGFDGSFKIKQILFSCCNFGPHTTDVFSCTISQMKQISWVCSSKNRESNCLAGSRIIHAWLIVEQIGVVCTNFAGLSGTGLIELPRRTIFFDISRISWSQRRGFIDVY